MRQLCNSSCSIFLYLEHGPCISTSSTTGVQREAARTRQRPDKHARSVKLVFEEKICLLVLFLDGNILAQLMPVACFLCNESLRGGMLSA